MAIVDEWTQWGGGGGGLPLKSAQRVDVAVAAFGTVSGTAWNVNNAVTLPIAVDPSYTVAFVRPLHPGANVEYSHPRAYVSGATSVQLLTGPYASWFNTNSPQYALSVWAWEFEPSAVESVQTLFWQYNTAGIMTFPTPIVDLSKLLLFENNAWYRNSSVSQREGVHSYWSLSNTQVRFNFDTYNATGGILHCASTFVELK